MKAVDLPKAAVIITSILAVGFTLVFWANSPAQVQQRIDRSAVEQAAKDRHSCILSALGDESKLATARFAAQLALHNRNELHLFKHMKDYDMVSKVYCN